MIYEINYCSVPIDYLRKLILKILEKVMTIKTIFNKIKTSKWYVYS